MALDKNPRLAISAGHGMNSRKAGAKDPGASIKRENDTEADFALRFSKHIFEDFQALFSGRRKGFVVLIDKVKYYKADDVAANKDCDLFIEFHLNSGGGTGTEVLYEATKNKKFAIALSKEIAASWHGKNRGAKHRTDLAVLTPHDGMYQVLAELFFADNPKDLKKFRDNAPEPELAVVNRILKHYGWKPVTSLPRKWSKLKKLTYKAY